MPYHRCSKCHNVDATHNRCVQCGFPTYQAGTCGACTLDALRLAGASAVAALIGELFDGIRACAIPLGICEVCETRAAVETIGGGAAATFHVCAKCARAAGSAS